MTQQGMPPVGSGHGERRGRRGWWPMPKISERDRRALAGYTYSPKIARRFRIVLLVAAGWSDAAIARDVGVSSGTVARWRQRFVAEGIAGLIGRRTVTASTSDQSARIGSDAKASGRGMGADPGPGRRPGSSSQRPQSTTARERQTIPSADASFAIRGRAGDQPVRTRPHTRGKQIDGTDRDGSLQPAREPRELAG